MRKAPGAISRRRLLAAAIIALPAVGLARIMGGEEVGAADVSVNIVNFTFQPNPLTVPVGTTVVWTNQDTAPHTATSDTAGIFDTGMLQKGQSGRITFNTAGTWAYHCTVHPNMHGTVTVTAQGAGATTGTTTAPSASAPSAVAPSGPIVVPPVPQIPMPSAPSGPQGYRPFFVRRLGDG
jgi:plastocyanin